MSKKITEKVTWVGKVDWELTHFHGDELSTLKGSSYNSYLSRTRRLCSSTPCGDPMTASLWRASRRWSTSRPSTP